MVTKVFCLACLGLKVSQVEIEVDIQKGLPGISVIGLADEAVRESKHRVKSAIKNSGFEIPSKKIVINLAPANIQKSGSHYDLAMALAWLNSNFQTNIDFQKYYLIGELSLDGMIRPVDGILPMVLKAREDNKKIIIPCENKQEASLVEGVQLYAAKDLKEVYNLLLNDTCIYWQKNGASYQNNISSYDIDFNEVKGQQQAKRAIEIAVAGMHNILMIGPPGVGKSMLAARIPTILPEMNRDEMIEVTKIHSIAGSLKKRKVPLITERPFRAPHHTLSHIALVGGGTRVMPGEITLAHHGVLFMDELPEFNRLALESLRQPLEKKEINIARAQQHVTFPSNFLFVGAMNPCPCGYLLSKDKTCRCTSYQIQKYRNKISGPLLDRIDIHIELTNIGLESIFDKKEEKEGSKEIKKRIENTRSKQIERFDTSVQFNSQIKNKNLEKLCNLSQNAEKMLKKAVKYYNFSLRAYTKIIKVARTIADLEDHNTIQETDIAEAVQYRSLDKALWL
ncbi:MAG: YifB family Mg chelatase-like AAA ATPase [Candidatus Omnitrophica bacterium]|nr:YifB family Mg chelatase-like AAA ATPase [Candidatus Omnitrophota bacterium]MDD5080865.1 YifB family Mg chelatase-like AAA ATPase [Candidatus Omnitrophota bacterium]